MSGGKSLVDDSVLVVDVIFVFVVVENKVVGSLVDDDVFVVEGDFSIVKMSDGIYVGF